MNWACGCTPKLFRVGSCGFSWLCSSTFWSTCWGVNRSRKGIPWFVWGFVHLGPNKSRQPFLRSSQGGWLGWTCCSDSQTWFTKIWMTSWKPRWLGFDASMDCYGISVQATNIFGLLKPLPIVIWLRANFAQLNTRKTSSSFKLGWLEYLGSMFTWSSIFLQESHANGHREFINCSTL